MNREHTEILKIKVNDAGEVELNLIDRESGWTWAGTCSRISHPDLPNALDKLSWFVAESNDLLINRKVSDILKAKKKSYKEIASVLKNVDAQMIDDITVTGVSFKGNEENRAVVITGKRSFHHTGGALNSPLITLDSDTFGFEESMKEPLEKVIDEVMAYVFDLKGSLFGETEKEEVEKEA